MAVEALAQRSPSKELKMFYPCQKQLALSRGWLHICCQHFRARAGASGETCEDARASVWLNICEAVESELMTSRSWIRQLAAKPRPASRC